MRSPERRLSSVRCMTQRAGSATRWSRPSPRGGKSPLSRSSTPRRPGSGRSDPPRRPRRRERRHEAISIGRRSHSRPVRDAPAEIDERLCSPRESHDGKIGQLQHRVSPGREGQVHCPPIDPLFADRQEEVRQEPPVRRPGRRDDGLLRGLRLPCLHNRRCRGDGFGNQQLRFSASLRPGHPGQGRGRFPVSDTGPRGTSGEGAARGRGATTSTSGSAVFPGNGPFGGTGS